MGKVRDIMQKNVVTIAFDKTALEAAQLLKEKDISFLVIMRNNRPIGLVTEKDFLQKISAEDKRSSKVRLSEIMSYKFRFVEPSTDIEDAVQKMLNNKIRRLIVMEDGKLAGVITQTDLTVFLRNKLLINGTIEKINVENSQTP